MLNLLATRFNKASNLEDPLGALLIAVNSLLLGIWVLRGTIALRNILLVAGFLISVIYIVRLIRRRLWSPAVCKLQLWLPVLMIACLFAWVIFHYFFLSMDPISHLQEIKSTWFRAFLAWVMAFVCALAILRVPNRLSWLALGLLSNFAGLIVEYIPLAIQKKQMANVLPVVDNYLQGKIYAVALGALYLGGVLGLVSTKIAGQTRLSWRIVIYWSLCLIPIFYSYIYIADTRNGVGVSVLLFLGWLLWILFYVRKNFDFVRQHFSLWKMTFIFCIALVIMLGAIGLQSKQNKGWSSNLDDALIAIQIDKYNNWQNPPVLGYPPEVKAINTYERAAWFVAALSVIPDRLLGDGTLKYAFGRAIKDRYPQSNLFISHSPWLDFTLSLGIPGIFCLLGSLLTTCYLSFNYKESLTHYVRWMSLSILLTYLVAELFNQAAFEILIYVCGFLPGLLLKSTYIYSRKDV